MSRPSFMPIGPKLLAVERYIHTDRQSFFHFKLKRIALFMTLLCYAKILKVHGLCCVCTISWICMLSFVTKSAAVGLYTILTIKVKYIFNLQCKHPFSNCNTCTCSVFYFNLHLTFYIQMHFMYRYMFV